MLKYGKGGTRAVGTSARYNRGKGTSGEVARGKVSIHTKIGGCIEILISVELGTPQVIQSEYRSRQELVGRLRAAR